MDEEVADVINELRREVAHLRVDIVDLQGAFAELEEDYSRRRLKAPSAP